MTALTTLPYTIYSTSPFSHKYPPENILDNLPLDQSSRWSAALASDPSLGFGNGYGNGGGIASVGTSGSASGGNISGVVTGAEGERWIVVKLERKAVVAKIGWGKFCKPHPCNVRTFRLWGSLEAPHASTREGAPSKLRWPTATNRLHLPIVGPQASAAFTPTSATNERLLSLRREPHKWILLYEGTVRNDDKYEEFDVRVRDARGLMCPVQYLKIEPVAQWCHAYNTSIWYLKFLGIQGPQVVDRAMEHWDDYVTTQSLHLALKFLRHHTPHLHSLHTTLSSLVTTLPPFPPRLDHPFLSNLWTTLVINGDFTAAETMLEQAANKHGFFDWLSEREGVGMPTAFWKVIHTPDRDGDVPCGRGGHAMVFVPAPRGLEEEGAGERHGKVVLFGGWTGTRSLADLWEWSGRWECISRNTEMMPGGGPSPRSIHRACVDEETGDVYFLGMYRENQKGTGKSDFWKYLSWSRKWELISRDTSEENGPPLLHEHQMVFDGEAKALYVFGGKIQVEKSKTQDDQTGSSSEERGYAGMYKYDVLKRTWSCIFKDLEDPKQPSGRVGHSMLLDPIQRLMYIFSGQTGNKFRRDAWVCTLPPIEGDDRETKKMKFARLDPTHDPFNGEHGNVYTSIGRATLDYLTGEWTLMSGIEPQSDPPYFDSPSGTLWMRIKTGTRKETSGKWVHVESGVSSDGQPPPRFAHQFVYDQDSKMYYLFGGNPVDEDHNDKRLGDFWSLTLSRQTPQEILRKAKFHVRKQRFLEMCAVEGPSISVLSYLQESLGSLVNHQHEAEAEAFRSLMAHLLQSSPTKNSLISEPFESHDHSFNEDERDILMGSSSIDTDKFDGEESQPASDVSTKLDQATWKQRGATYDALMEFFPEEHKEPKQSLRDFIAWNGLPAIAT